MLNTIPTTRVIIFLTLVTVSFFALANTDIAREKLTAALDQWKNFSPSSYTDNALSKADTAGLGVQQSLNKQALDAIGADTEGLDAEELNELKAINDITESILAKDSWKDGIAAAGDTSNAPIKIFRKVVASVNPEKTKNENGKQNEEPTGGDSVS